MAIQRIESRRTIGWQARATLPGKRGHQTRLTRFFSDGAHGGKRRALKLARLAEIELKAKARRA
jgi:hypothetical protein